MQDTAWAVSGIEPLEDLTAAFDWGSFWAGAGSVVVIIGGVAAGVAIT